MVAQLVLGLLADCVAGDYCDGSCDVPNEEEEVYMINENN